MYENGFRSTIPLMEYTVPESDLVNVNDVSFSMWLKWSFQYPDFASVEDLKVHPVSIAHVTETGRTGTNFGDRALSLWLKPFSFGTRAFGFATYAENQGRPDWEQVVPIENDGDFDAAWIFVYFAHSGASSDTYAYVRYQSETVVTKVWQNAIHYKPPEGLTFRVGKTENNEFSWNGFIYNIQF